MKVSYGYMGKMLFVDLTNGKVTEEEITEEFARNYIGGYGIGAKIIMQRMKKGADPLGHDNILGFGTGPLTLSGAISTCRFTAMGKSPLTGFWGAANGGGSFANALKASGYDLVFFEGKAPHPLYLVIKDGKAQLKDARHIWGKKTPDTEEAIRQENGADNLKIACIGPAGEKLARISCIINDGGRAAARSGLGGIMGSKNLKAVACRGSLRPEVFDKARVKDLVKEFRSEMKNNPSGMSESLTQFGTASAMVEHLTLQDTPIKNYSGNNLEDFPEEKWGAVGWEGMERYEKKKYGCTGCPIACGGWVTVESDKYAVEKGHKPEYETLAAFGPSCLNDNIESLLYANELCNSNGLDTISAGSTIAFAIECYENGILTKQDTDGIELTWGNSAAIIQVLEKMCRREGIGDILADGARIAAAKIGRGAEKFAMHVGGEMIPMHDPRQAPGFGATYVSDSTPARHTRGGTQFIEQGFIREKIVAPWGIPARMDRYDPTNKGEVRALCVARQHLVEVAGACSFAADSLPFPLLEFLQETTGWDLSYEELIKIGKRIETLLHAFNLREGFKPSDFKMPPRVSGNPPLKAGPLKGVTVDFEDLKRRYYEAMGYDPETGEIRKERIVELGLEDVLP